MPILKFSHNYPKLHNQKFGTLLKVTIINFYNLQKNLIEYDTKTTEGIYYQLPKEDLIHLTFLGDNLIPFCTMRRYKPMKYDYYKRLIGQDFEILIENKR